MAAVKRWLFWKRKLLKKSSSSDKKMLEKSNCCVEVVTLKKCEEVVSPKINLSWKILYICEKGNHHFQKNPKLNSLLRLVEIIFPERLLHPDTYSWGISHEYQSYHLSIILSWWPELTEEEIISLCLCHTIFTEFQSFIYRKQKICLNSFFSLLIFLLRGLFLFLIQYVLLKV